MPTPIALQKVNIAPSRYYSIVDGVATEITEEQYNLRSMGDTAYSKRIAFDTPTGQLTDGQYATQGNGHHWVKIPGYKVIKIDPDYIANNKVTSAGVTHILKDSEAE